jgi:hypothetical protein
VVTTAVLPDAEPSIAYSAQLLASGALDPVVWTLALGALPDGLSLSEQGLITGVPTQVQTTAFVVAVQDAQGQVARRTMAIQVSQVQGVQEGGCRCVDEPEPSANYAYGCVLLLGLLVRRRRN